MQHTLAVLHTASKVLFASLLLVLAWTIFSAASAQASGLLGSLTGSYDASSEVEDAEDGLLSSVTEPDARVSPVTDLATDIVRPVTTVAEPVTDLVTDVVRPVATVTEPVTELVTEVVRPVTGLVDDVAAPVVGVVKDLPVVGSVTEPVVDVVNQLPVVGGVTEPISGRVPEPAPVVAPPVEEPLPVVPELVAVPAISVPVAPQSVVSVPTEEAPVEAAATILDAKPLSGPQPVISDPVISVVSDPSPAPQEILVGVDDAVDAESAVWSVPGNQSPEPAASTVAGSGSAGPGSSLRTSADSGSGAPGDIPQGFSSDWLNGLSALFDKAESIPRSLALDHGFPLTDVVDAACITPRQDGLRRLSAVGKHHN